MSSQFRNRDVIEELLIHQLHNYWIDVDELVIHKAIPNVMKKIELCFKKLPSSRFYKDDEVQFSPQFSIHWMLFLYRLANEIYSTRKGNETPKEADEVYYLNKIMHSNDWFYAVDLPVHFLCEHPLGSVLGRAKYGDYFCVYQGTTVGGNWSNGVIDYPSIGENVILYANATVLGNSHIGNNVIVSADSYIINDEVPDNALVFGKSPNLIIKEKSVDEIMAYTDHIWGWSKR